ncbi:MAG: penicillin-binding protein 1A [Gammaproteobacteria bacterium]
MNDFFKKLRIVLLVLLGLFAVSGLAAGGIYSYLAPKLPSTEHLKDVRLQVPLRVYTHDGKLIGEFGEMKRIPLKYAEVPDLMVKAVLAAEDDRYFQHHGVDYQGLLRASWYLLTTGEKGQGGSTITMQVARNFFLSSEKTYSRKISEIMLAMKIDRELTKEEILELYLNKIYLGNRAYGLGAAAQVYYGTDLKHLSVAQMAMLAGLPKAPSRFNPIIAPARALERRNYVLRRLHELGNITDDVFQASLAEPDRSFLHALIPEVEAPDIAEMARAVVVERYGEAAYTSGMRVYTTLDSRLQRAATTALRSAVLAYDGRHGYRGPERHVNLSASAGPQEWRKALEGLSTMGGLPPGVVIGVQPQAISVALADGSKVQIPWAGLSWAQGYRASPRAVAASAGSAAMFRTGDVVRLQSVQGGQWRLAQLPKVEGAMVAIKPDDGAIVSLAGGFDFARSKFNRVTQASRQPGSSFKPFLYSAALEHGYTPASLINDAPLMFGDATDPNAWRPQNYNEEFLGPMRLREALVLSRNLVSIRLLQAVGLETALNHVSRFGFQTQNWPRNLSLALGSMSVTPLDLARAYTVFANGGYRVQPYYIERIEDINGAVLMQAKPARVCPTCTDATAAPRVISAQNVYLMTSMMQDVIRRGTAKRAMQLGRQDLAGKTGTTNEQRDTWFAGYNPGIVAVSWLGFDTPTPMGAQETGGSAALPMWMSFMTVALNGVPERPIEQPPGLVSVRINPATGLLAGANDPNAIFETFPENAVPAEGEAQPAVLDGGAEGGAAAPEQLF